MKVPAKVLAWALTGAVAVATPFIGQWEGLRTDPYNDLGGIKTVCYGETNVPMRSYSKKECEEILAKSVKVYAEGVLKCTPTLAYKPYVLWAATSFSYNLGVPTYCKSSAAKHFKAERWEEGCEALGLYNKVKGRYYQGLANRRKAEIELCKTGL